jgi:predicted enzyme related to lactoylglutathione lyase
MAEPPPPLPLHDPRHDRRIDYIEMAASSIADTKRFYQDVFGWKFTDYGPEYTSFEDGRLAAASTRRSRREPGRSWS